MATGSFELTEMSAQHKAGRVAVAITVIFVRDRSARYALGDALPAAYVIGEVLCAGF